LILARAILWAAPIISYCSHVRARMNRWRALCTVCTIFGDDERFASRSRESFAWPFAARPLFEQVVSGLHGAPLSWKDDIWKGPLRREAERCDSCGPHDSAVSPALAACPTKAASPPRWWISLPERCPSTCRRPRTDWSEAWPSYFPSSSTFGSLPASRQANEPTTASAFGGVWHLHSSRREWPPEDLQPASARALIVIDFPRCPPRSGASSLTYSALIGLSGHWPQYVAIHLYAIDTPSTEAAASTACSNSPLNSTIHLRPSQPALTRPARVHTCVPAPTDAAWLSDRDGKVFSCDMNEQGAHAHRSKGVYLCIRVQHHKEDQARHGPAQFRDSTKEGGGSKPKEDRVDQVKGQYDLVRYQSMQGVIAGLGNGRTTKIAMTGGAGVAVHRALIGSPNLGPVRTLKSCPQLLYIGSNSC
jgi:hypothetical protein